ncbi:MAG: hypothetical protein N3B21_12780 [Clostridia bacterium]|nr:hypothetical protein [Clostridia bacterium]
MQQFTWMNFLVQSVPEAFLMSLIVWLILGKRQEVKFRGVIIASLMLATSLAGFKNMLYPQLFFYGVLQILAFAFIMYFMYKLSYNEAIIGCFITAMIVAVVQQTIIGVGYVITGIDYASLPENSMDKIGYSCIEFIMLALFATVLYKKNFKIFNFKKKRMSEFYSNKIRYLVLQLVFIFIILFFNYRMFFWNTSLFKTDMDKLLLIAYIGIIIIFTAISIKSAFRMGESIQKEEEQKRILDGREIIQNIDYICTLIDANKYDEVREILKSIKNDVDLGMVNVSEKIMGDPIK